jgi:hypothetical protein
MTASLDTVPAHERGRPCPGTEAGHAFQHRLADTGRHIQLVDDPASPPPTPAYQRLVAWMASPQWAVGGIHSDLFAVAGLHVAAPAEQERPLTDRDTTALTQAERKDIAYHPARVVNHAQHEGWLSYQPAPVFNGWATSSPPALSAADPEGGNP